MISQTNAVKIPKVVLLFVSFRPLLQYFFQESALLYFYPLISQEIIIIDRLFTHIIIIKQINIQKDQAIHLIQYNWFKGAWAYPFSYCLP